MPSSAWADSRATLAAGNESAPPAGKPDYDITIGTGLIEVAPGRIVSTTTYNGQFPGPLLRFREGQQTTVDIHNHRDVPEPLHWHGQFVPPDIEGDAAHHFLPDAGVDPVLKTRGEAAMKASLAKGMPHGYEVGYRLFTINGQPYDWQTKPVTRTLDRGKRYRRLRMHNVADDIHPIHLHRNSFEITRFAGQASALMFVAFTGYGRIATFGEEVHAPERTIPPAILTTLTISAVVYIAVAVVAVGTFGSDALSMPGVAWLLAIGLLWHATVIARSGPDSTQP